MTESEWLTSEDPQAMLLLFMPSPGETGRSGVEAEAPGPARFALSERKLRLFCYAWRAAAGIHDPDDSFSEAADPPTVAALHGGVHAWALSLASLSSVPPAVQSALLREIVGNPFRPVSRFREERIVETTPGGQRRSIWPEHAWLTPLVQGIAAVIYEWRDWQDLPVLADALEEAGYVCPEQEAARSVESEPSLLVHLRNPGPHVRGCWVLDLILGKE